MLSIRGPRSMGPGPQAGRIWGQAGGGGYIHKEMARGRDPKLAGQGCVGASRGGGDRSGSLG